MCLASNRPHAGCTRPAEIIDTRESVQLPASDKCVPVPYRTCFPAPARSLATQLPYPAIGPNQQLTRCDSAPESASRPPLTLNRISFKRLPSLSPNSRNDRTSGFSSSAARGAYTALLPPSPGFTVGAAHPVRRPRSRRIPVSVSKTCANSPFFQTPASAEVE